MKYFFHPPFDIADATITVMEPAVRYDGSAHEPELTVTYEGEPLTPDADYSFTVADNTEPGEATITVTGMGEFSGTTLVTFSIKNVLGDVDGNGAVDPYDASIIQRALAGISVDDLDRVSALGDVDANGLASIDVTYILRYLSVLPTPYPIDEMTDIV